MQPRLRDAGIGSLLHKLDNVIVQITMILFLAVSQFEQQLNYLHGDQSQDHRKYSNCHLCCKVILAVIRIFALVEESVCIERQHNRKQ